MAYTAPKTMPTPGGGKTRTLVPADSYPAICCGVIELGMHMDAFPGQEPKLKPRMKIQFEIPEVKDDTGQSVILSKTIYNVSYNEKATFRILLDTWLGKGWEAEHGGKPLSFLIGLAALIGVDVETKDNGRDVNKITSITRLPARLGPVVMTRDPFYLDLSKLYLPGILSVWDAETIRASAEYAANQFRDDAPTLNDSSYANTAKATPAPMPSRVGNGHRFDDGADDDHDLAGPAY